MVEIGQVRVYEKSWEEFYNEGNQDAIPSDTPEGTKVVVSGHQKPDFWECTKADGDTFTCDTEHLEAHTTLL